MKTAGWMTITEQIKITTAVHTWKAIHLGKPNRMHQKFQITPDLKCQVPPPRLHFTQSCYRWRAANLWNTLEPDMRQEISISRFKKRIKMQVLEERN